MAAIITLSYVLLTLAHHLILSSESIIIPAIASRPSSVLTPTPSVYTALPSSSIERSSGRIHVCPSLSRRSFAPISVRSESLSTLTPQFDVASATCILYSNKIASVISTTLSPCANWPCWSSLSPLVMEYLVL